MSIFDIHLRKFLCMYVGIFKLRRISSERHYLSVEDVKTLFPLSLCHEWTVVISSSLGGLSNFSTDLRMFRIMQLVSS